MHFHLSRPLMSAVIIEANSVEELIFQASTYGEFRDEDLERIFSEKRRNHLSRCTSNDDIVAQIMRLTDRELKSLYTKICPECVKNKDTRYIPDDAPMCDHHLLDKYNLYEHITYDSCDCLGMEELIPADEVIKILRRLDK